MDSARIAQRNLAIFLLTGLAACAHTPRTPQTADVSVQSTPSETDLLRQQVTKLQDRVQDLEVRLGALNDKINLENGAPPSSADTSKIPTVAVEAPAAHGKVIPEKKIERKGKPQTADVAMGGAADGVPASEAIDRFREAKILYDSKRYSDSVLEFAEFVKNEPDHPLAAAAQYYVGMSYFKQNEYKLAEEELSRGLLSYAHSSYVPDTLLALTQVSDLLKKPARVSYFKEKILTNFPNSPQAKSLTASSKSPEPEAKAAVPVKNMETMEEPSVVSKPEVPSVSKPTLESDPE